jgi:hypothetical protein
MTFGNTFGTNCYDYPCGPSFGWVFKKIGQPTVIGKYRGIVWASYWDVFPWFSAALFPVESLEFKVFSQLTNSFPHVRYRYGARY